MYLVAGLGNPGPQYAGNRHNVGFMFVDRLADGVGFREKFKGEYAKVRVGSADVVLLKPMTFMNLSGESVQPALHFFRVPPERLVVVHDELDLPLGVLRLKKGGGSAGHNGLKSIAQHCGGPDFIRLRIGIGRPVTGRPQGWVLSDFSASESVELNSVLESAVRTVERIVQQGLSNAMSECNQKSSS